MEAIVGGVIIGIAVTIMLVFNGRVTGISGIIGETLKPNSLDKNWRYLFLAGLLCGGLILRFTYPVAFTLESHAAPVDYILAGLLVGVGTLLGSGCTSGHGVCGISRLSLRSIISTVLFITSGILSVILFKYFRGDL
jgi:uncharacterized membrane protein YedE/YeeE